MALAAALAATGQAGSEPFSCPGVPVSISGAEGETTGRICADAAAAIEMLESCGMPLGTPVEIALTDSLSPGCLGIYHCGEHRIDLLSPHAMEAARAPDSLFRDVPAAPFYRSVITHELAHAAFDGVPCPFAACPVTDEFLAYAMQVRALPAELIARVEARLPVDMPVGRDAFSVIQLQMAPEHFIAKAHKHLASRPDPCGHVARITAGEITYDRERFSDP